MDAVWATIEVASSGCFALATLTFDARLEDYWTYICCFLAFASALYE